ncbi:MAG: sulfatase-like hydrolase/transferase, partial [Planctomycetota bacterium]|nr:sulfatase-like hydrolase/transferase [Planctomycetota bacterium]
MNARGLVMLGLLAGAGAGCGSELPFEGAYLALVDRADRIDVEVERPLPIPEGVTAAWVRDGLAGIRLTIESAQGRATEDDNKRIVTWPLPLAMAENAGGAEMQPEMIGLPIPLVVPEVGPEPGQTAGFWIEGSRLYIAHRVGDELPETFDLVYPVYAAQLAGTALVSGFPSEDVFRVTRLRDGMAIESLVVPGGGTLHMRLPRLPEGRFQMTFTTLGHQAPGPERENLVPELTLRIDGEELYMAVLEEDGSPVVLQVGDDPGLPTEPTRTEVAFEIEVKGLPGSVVFVESPFHRRERNWRDHSNVILIVVDTLRADRLGAYGNRRGLTPNLDVLAAESVRFEQCWATSSWTLPSFASMLTSTHGGQHRAWLNDTRLGRGLTTLPEAFRRRGYRTHAITDGGFVGPGFGLDRGFMVFDARGGGVEAVQTRAVEFL